MPCHLSDFVKEYNKTSVETSGLEVQGDLSNMAATLTRQLQQAASFFH